MELKNNFMKYYKEIKERLNSLSHHTEFIKKIQNSKILTTELINEGPNSNDSTFKTLYYIFFLGNLFENKQSLIRIYKNIGIIQAIISDKNFKYSEDLIQIIKNYSSFCTLTEVLKLLIIKQITKNQQNFITILLKIKESVKKGVKKLFKFPNLKKIIEFLSICHNLKRTGYSLNSEINTLLIYSAKMLESKYNFHNSRQEVQYFSQVSDYDEAFLILKLVENLTIDNLLLQVFFHNYSQHLRVILNNYQARVKIFPPKVSKKIVLSTFDVKSLQLSQLLNGCIGDQEVYICASSIQNEISINVKIIPNSRQDLLEEIETLRMLKRLVKGCHNFPVLLKFYQDQFYTYMLFEAHPTNLMAYLSITKNQNEKISEELLKIWAKSLIKSFAILEKLGIVHGDVSPFNIFMNNNFELKIYNFKKCPQRMTVYNSPPSELIQDSSGYYLENTESDDIKRDVFALGLVLLQIYYLIDIKVLQNNYSLVQVIENIDIHWLRDLLIKMLDPIIEARPSFSDLKAHKY